MHYRLKRKFLPWLVFHTWEFKWYYLGALISLIILQELQSAIPQRIRSLTVNLELTSFQSQVFIVFLALALGILIFRTFSRLLFFYPARVQQKILRLEILGMIEKSSFHRLDQFQQGKLFQVLFDDVSNLRAFVGFGLLQIFNIIIATVVLVPKINESDSYLWPAFTPLFLSVGFFTALTLWNQKIFKQMLDKKDDVQQFLIETYEAKQSIKNFQKEDAFVKKFNELSQGELKLFYKYSLGYAFTAPYVKLGIGASLIWGAILIKIQGGNSSDLVFFAGFLYLFLEPVVFLSWVAVVTSQGLSAWKRIKEIFNSLQSPIEQENNLQNRSILLNDSKIEFEMESWERLLKISFNKSKWTVLVGETGCGKSHLLIQIATFFSIKKINYSMVQQVPYLFNGSISENIFLGRKMTSDLEKKVLELFQVFQLDSLGVPLEELLELEVGENGKRLSGGQMKRIALIRSLVSDADFFIWDDPFSSVDIILEKKIIQFLRNHQDWSSKTFLISSHRLTGVKLCDALIYLAKEKGIVEQGMIETSLKEKNVSEFFKEQMVEYSLD